MAGKKDKGALDPKRFVCKRIKKGYKEKVGSTAVRLKQTFDEQGRRATAKSTSNHQPIVTIFSGERDGKVEAERYAQLLNWATQQFYNGSGIFTCVRCDKTANGKLEPDGKTWTIPKDWEGFHPEEAGLDTYHKTEVYCDLCKDEQDEEEDEDDEEEDSVIVDDAEVESDTEEPDEDEPKAVKEEEDELKKDEEKIQFPEAEGKKDSVKDELKERMRTAPPKNNDEKDEDDEWDFTPGKGMREQD